MVRFASLSFALMLCATVFSQASPIKLDTAAPIDIHVTDVNWHTAGKALIYARDEEKGFGLGAFAPGKFEGKVLIHLQKGDTYQINWLPGGPSALVVVHSPAPEAKVKSTQVRIFLVEADTQVSRQIFSEVFPEKGVPGVSVDPSPSLKHAIVTLQFQKESRTLVLCQGRGDLAMSPDLDRAIKAGASGPTWSVDGTAIYTNPTGKSESNSGPPKEVTLSIGSDTVTTTAANVDGGEVKLLGLVTSDINEKVVLLSGLKFALFVRAIPNVGAPVLELMPTNAVIRPVRFRGAWDYPEEVENPLVPQSQPVLLHFDKSNVQESSTWLKRESKRDNAATLVAVRAQRTWMAPREVGVAYVIDGALFVRTIGGK